MYSVSDKQTNRETSCAHKKTENAQKDLKICLGIFFIYLGIFFICLGIFFFVFCVRLTLQIA